MHFIQHNTAVHCKKCHVKNNTANVNSELTYALECDFKTELRGTLISTLVVPCVIQTIILVTASLNRRYAIGSVKHNNHCMLVR